MKIKEIYEMINIMDNREPNDNYEIISDFIEELDKENKQLESKVKDYREALGLRI